MRKNADFRYFQAKLKTAYERTMNVEFLPTINVVS